MRAGSGSQPAQRRRRRNVVRVDYAALHEQLFGVAAREDDGFTFFEDEDDDYTSGAASSD